MHDYDKKVIIRKAEKILQECNQKYEKKKLKSTENCKLVAKLNKQNKRLKRILFSYLYMSFEMQLLIKCHLWE